MGIPSSHLAGLLLLPALATLGAAEDLPDASRTMASGPSYETNFDGNENPISEGGAWAHTGLDWTPVAKSNGIAYGTQSGTRSQPRANLYDDSYAVLAGFPPDQAASAVIHRSSSVDGSCSHEFEILLRWSDDAHNARGYELNLNYDGGYAQIMRWNGPYGDFTEIGSGSYPNLKAGDTFEGTIVGNVITSYVNGTKVAEAIDNTYATGNPGIGLFRGSCGANTDIGFVSFRASGSGGPSRPKPPSEFKSN